MKIDVIDVTCFAINNFGSGQHPVADRHNIQHFKSPYVRSCLRKMIKSSAVVDAVKIVAIELNDAINQAEGR